MEAHAALLPASRAALTLLRRAERVEVRGAGGGMVHLDAGGGVVTLAAPGVPLLANAIRVDAAGRLPGRVARWDPRVAPLAGGPERLAARARGLGAPSGLGPEGLAERLAERTAVGDTPRGRAGVRALAEAIALGAPERAEAASDRLLGLGPGLTPEGDDLLAAGAVVVNALGGAAGLRPARRRAIAAALCPAGAARRTTALSATLLRLAAVGAGPAPLGRMLHGDASARAELERLGRSSGRALAEGAATLTAALLAA